MSRTDADKFFSQGNGDPKLQAKVMSGASTQEDFLRNAVAQGKALGLMFTPDEAKASIQAAFLRMTQEAGGQASDEITDSQLDAVAGGWWTSGTTHKTDHTPWWYK